MEVVVHQSFSYVFFYTFVFIIRLVLINFIVMVGLVFGTGK